MKRFDDAAFERMCELLAARPAIALEDPSLRRASVLAPMMRREDGWAMLFLKRSSTMTAHRGQIAFPGGGVEPGEPFELAAMREAEEEVGIPRDRVRIVGRLDDVVAISGFVVAPFVGVVPAGLDYVLQTSEVDEIYEVPMHALLDPRNPEVRYIDFRDRKYPTYVFHHEALEIWGLTATMVKSLLDVAWQAM